MHPADFAAELRGEVQVVDQVTLPGQRNAVVGLAVALPAVLIYNFFVRRNRLRLAALEEFGHDLFTLLVTGFEQVATNNVTPLVERETRQGRG